MTTDFQLQVFHPKSCTLQTIMVLQTAGYFEGLTLQWKVILQDVNILPLKINLDI